MERLNIFVAGRWREGRGEEMASVFPADGSVNARLRAANVEDVNEAVEAAERAWRAPEWRGLVPHQRASILYRVSNLILAQQEQLAELQTRDNGKPLAETRGLVASAAATARYFAAACDLLTQRRHHHRFDGMHAVFRLVENDARRGFKYLVGHFHTTVQAVLRRHLFAERGLVVVERGQAVEEFHLRIAGQRHHLAIYLIPAQQRDTLRPLLFGFAHRYPDVGIDKVRALHARRNIFGHVCSIDSSSELP